MPTQLARTCEIFNSRLETLAALLNRGSKYCTAAGRDPETLLSERLASDMYPLAFQIVFTVEQARQLVAFCAERDAGPFVDSTQLTLATARALIDEVRASIAAIDAGSDRPLAREKTMELQGGIMLTLSGSDYIDEWLMPNFYFHLVTAYGILRHVGVPLGKANYMAHIAHRIPRASR